MEPQPGDQVIFHLLGSHYCGGMACACVPDMHVPATVIIAHPQDYEQKIVLQADPDDKNTFLPTPVDDLTKPRPRAVILDLEFPTEKLIHADSEGKQVKPDHEDAKSVYIHRGITAMLDGDVEIDMKVATSGHTSRQSHSRQATTQIPESGTWTWP